MSGRKNDPNEFTLTIYKDVFFSELNTKLKEFIRKVQDKCSNLLRALKLNSDTLRFEAVVEYLRKSSIMLKGPKYTRDRQRVNSQSPSISKRNEPPDMKKTTLLGLVSIYYCLLYGFVRVYLIRLSLGLFQAAFFLNTDYARIYEI